MARDLCEQLAIGMGDDERPATDAGCRTYRSHRAQPRADQCAWRYHPGRRRGDGAVMPIADRILASKLVESVVKAEFVQQLIAGLKIQNRRAVTRILYGKKAVPQPPSRHTISIRREPSLMTCGIVSAQILPNYF